MRNMKLVAVGLAGLMAVSMMTACGEKKADAEMKTTSMEAEIPAEEKEAVANLFAEENGAAAGNATAVIGENTTNVVMEEDAEAEETESFGTAGTEETTRISERE